MPKLRQLTTLNSEKVVKQLDETRMSLFSAMQALNRHYRKDHRLVKRARAFYDMFADFKKDCETEFKEKLQRT